MCSRFGLLVRLFLLRSRREGWALYMTNEKSSDTLPHRCQGPPKAREIPLGAIGPLSGFRWPVQTEGRPGAWVEAEGALDRCSRGVHVCRPSDLAHWIHDELWELETSGDEIDGLDCVVVQRARLVRRVDAWGQDGRQKFAGPCVEHAAASAMTGVIANVTCG